MTRIISYHLFWFHQTIYVFESILEKISKSEVINENIILTKNFPVQNIWFQVNELDRLSESFYLKIVLRSAFFTEQCIVTMGRRESSAPQSGVVLLFSQFHKRSLIKENHNSREMRFIWCRKMLWQLIFWVEKHISIFWIWMEAKYEKLSDLWLDSLVKNSLMTLKQLLPLKVSQIIYQI